MRRAPLAVGWVTVSLAGGCEQPRTELVVRVDSEVTWGAGRPIQSVVLSVRRGGADGPLRSTRTTALGVEAARQPLPLYVGVIAAGDETDTPVWIEALGCGDPNGCTVTTAAVAQRAVVRFVRGQTGELRLLLASACVGVTCASDQRCGAGGQCEAATAAQATVRPFAGAVAPVAEDAAVAPDVLANVGRDGFTAVDMVMADVSAEAGRDGFMAIDVEEADAPVVTDVPVAADVRPPSDVALPPGDDGTVVCPSGLVPCGSMCRNLQTDGANCGACGAACALRNVSTPTCVAGTIPVNVGWMSASTPRHELPRSSSFLVET